MKKIFVHRTYRFQKKLFIFISLIMIIIFFSPATCGQDDVRSLQKGHNVSDKSIRDDLWLTLIGYAIGIIGAVLTLWGILRKREYIHPYLEPSPGIKIPRLYDHYFKTRTWKEYREYCLRRFASNRQLVFQPYTPHVDFLEILNHPKPIVFWSLIPYGGLNVIHLIYLNCLKFFLNIGFEVRILYLDKHAQYGEGIQYNQIKTNIKKINSWLKHFGLKGKKTQYLRESELLHAFDNTSFLDSLWKLTSEINLSDFLEDITSNITQISDSSSPKLYQVFRWLVSPTFLISHMLNNSKGIICLDGMMRERHWELLRKVLQRLDMECPSVFFVPLIKNLEGFKSPIKLIDTIGIYDNENSIREKLMQTEIDLKDQLSFCRYVLEKMILADQGIIKMEKTSQYFGNIDDLISAYSHDIIYKKNLIDVIAKYLSNMFARMKGMKNV